MPQHGLSNTIVSPHVLCEICKSFWKRVTCLRITHDETLQDGVQLPSMPEHVLHSLRKSEREKSASLGCHFCSIIHGSTVGCTGDHGPSKSVDDKNEDDDDPLYISIARLERSNATFLLSFFSCEQQEIFSHDQILNSVPLRLCPTDGRFSTHTGFGDLSASIQTATPMLSKALVLSASQTSTWSQAAATFIDSWIAECRMHHPLCGPDFLSLLQGPDQSPPPRPRRVLDLQAFEDPERIRLVELETDADIEYCTLSYSWGFSTPYVMTSSNLAEFKKAIRVSDLPKLLRDTIFIARGIGFRYLWIDALCIMQDGFLSPVASEDWLDQAGKMHDIFGRSVITIAASEAFDGNQSLIMPRNPLSQTSCRLDWDADVSYEVVPTCTPSCLLHTFDKAQYHLDTRAWVFQERILSPRTIHVTRNFVHLECRTELKCEAMSGGNACHHSGAVAKADYHFLFAMFGPNGLDELAVELFLSYWHELVRKYSLTNLSRPSDLLVALAGLATQIQIKSRLTWSFGLWREHLVRGMLWYVRGGKGTAHRERAPTWSWASIEVKGPQITHDPITGISPVVEIIALPEISNFVRQPALSAAGSRYVVKLAGRLMPLKDSPLSMTLAKQHDIRIHRNCQGMPDIHRECPLHPDYELPTDLELYLLLFARGTGSLQRSGTFDSWVTEVGIILTPIAEYPHRYRRVGYFHHDIHRETESKTWPRSPSLFDNADIQEVEIV